MKCASDDAFYSADWDGSGTSSQDELGQAIDAAKRSRRTRLKPNRISAGLERMSLTGLIPKGQTSGKYLRL